MLWIWISNPIPMSIFCDISNLPNLYFQIYLCMGFYLSQNKHWLSLKMLWSSAVLNVSTLQQKSLRYAFVLFLFLQKTFLWHMREGPWWAPSEIIISISSIHCHIRSCIPPHSCLLSFVTVFRLSVTLKSLVHIFLIFFLSSLWKIILTNKIVIVHTNCAFYFAFCHSALINMFVYFLLNWEFLVTFKEGKSK